MQPDYLFLGNAIEAVGEAGEMPLPPFIGGCLEDVATCDLFIGPHESDPCLKGFVGAHAPALYAESERRRLSDEAAGISSDEHFGRIRRTFGQVERAPFGPGGTIRLTSWMRIRGRIEDEVLVLGTGATFEIWNPVLARKSDDPQLRELAAYRLGETRQAGNIDDQDEGESE